MFSLMPSIRAVTIISQTNCEKVTVSKRNVNKNKRKKRIVSLCSVLPLLPEERITEEWEYVKSQVLDFSERCDLDKFIKYEFLDEPQAHQVMDCL